MKYLIFCALKRLRASVASWETQRHRFTLFINTNYYINHPCRFMSSFSRLSA